MNREEFLNSCKAVFAEEENGRITVQQAANRVCRLCNENFDIVKPEFNQVMDIACDLELPDEHRDRALEDWEKLKGLEVFKR